MGYLKVPIENKIKLKMMLRLRMMMILMLWLRLILRLFNWLIIRYEPENSMRNRTALGNEQPPIWVWVG